MLQVPWSQRCALIPIVTLDFQCEADATPVAAGDVTSLSSLRRVATILYLIETAAQNCSHLYQIRWLKQSAT